jgi:hypothetical protein
LISSFWEATTVLVVIAIALCGGSWKIFSTVEENRRKYREDGNALRAILVTNELLPILLTFSGQLESAKTLEGVDKILEKQESGRTLRQMLQVSRKVLGMEDSIESILANCNRCGYDLLLLTGIPSISIVLAFLETTEFFYYALIVALTVLLAKTVLDFVRYRRATDRFTSKDKEIRENW